MATSTRIFFDGLPAAADGLIAILQYARTHGDQDFRFGPLKPQAVLQSGLWIEGQVDGVAAMLANKIPGAVRHDN